MARALTLDVEKRFDGGAVVGPAFDVALAKGRVLVLFGPSGSGKTTSLRMIAGLERPDRGVIRYDGQTWFDGARRVWWPPQRRRMGYVFQQPALFPHLSVRANVEFGVADRSAEARTRTAALMARLGIEGLSARLARGLSGGEAQRVALARALAPSPGLLLLDEPFAAVDTPARGRLRADLRALLRQADVPAVLVTHDRNEALAVGDLIAVLIGGRVRQIGGVTDVFSRPVDVDVAAAAGVETVVAATVTEATGDLLTVRIGPTTLDAVLHGADAIAPGADVLACIRAEDVTLEQEPAAGSSARNHLRGRIVSIDPDGSLDKVTLDCGFPLVALITHRSREAMELAPGLALAAAIKATAVHVVPRR